MKEESLIPRRSYEMQVKLPHAALPPKKTKRGDYSLLLRGDNFVWSIIIQANTREEATRIAANKYNSIRKTLKSNFPNLDLKVGNLVTVDDRYNEVVFADGNFRCCDWKNKFLDEHTVDRLIADSCGKLRRPTGKNKSIIPSVEWNHNSKQNKYIAPSRLKKTDINNLWYDEKLKNYVARIYYRRQITVGQKQRVVHDVRKESRTIKGRKLFAKGVIIERTLGKRIQDRKYKEVRFKAKNLPEARDKMNELAIQLKEKYNNVSIQSKTN